MNILSIETAGEICAVALLNNDKLIKEEIIEDARTHSVKLMPLLDKLLKETNMTIQDIDLFACDIGPGSFTGIRIGVSTVKAFLDVTNKKAIGISSLEALAYNVKEDGTICSLIDAKNDNAYYGFFEKKEDTFHQIGDLKFDNINNIIEFAKNKNKKIIFVGNGSITYRNMIQSKLENSTFMDEKNDKLNARNIGFAAYAKKENATDTNQLKPMYLRPSNAERQKQKT